MVSKKRCKLVSAVVLNWNGKHFLADCLGTLVKQDYPSLEIILSDNGSSDGSVEYVRENFPSVRIVENGRNLGFSGGVNAGIRAAKGDYIVILNNDMIFHRKDCISELVKAAESDERIGIVGAMLLWAKEPKRIQTSFLRGTAAPKEVPELSLGKLFKVPLDSSEKQFEEDHGQYTELIETDAVNGMIKREVFDKIGLYDEKFFLTYEEVDFCYRAKQAGYRVVINPRAKMWHVGAGTVKATSPFYAYNFFRSKVRFGLKNFKGYGKVVFLCLNLLFLPRIIVVLMLHGKFSLIPPVIRAYGWNLANFGDYL